MNITIKIIGGILIGLCLLGCIGSLCFLIKDIYVEDVSNENNSDSSLVIKEKEDITTFSEYLDSLEDLNDILESIVELLKKKCHMDVPSCLFSEKTVVIDAKYKSRYFTEQEFLEDIRQLLAFSWYNKTSKVLVVARLEKMIFFHGLLQPRPHLPSLKSVKRGLGRRVATSPQRFCFF